MVWNQTPERQTTTLKVPLYYTGLTTTAFVQREDGDAANNSINASTSTTSTTTSNEYKLARDYSITIPIEMEPMSITWFVIKGKA